MSIFTASGQMPSLRKASAGKIPETVLHYKAMQNSAPLYFFAGGALSCILGFTIKIWLPPAIIFLNVVLFVAWGCYFGRRGVREIQREAGCSEAAMAIGDGLGIIGSFADLLDQIRAGASGERVDWQGMAWDGLGIATAGFSYGFTRSFTSPAMSEREVRQAHAFWKIVVGGPGDVGSVCHAWFSDIC